MIFIRVEIKGETARDWFESHVFCHAFARERKGVSREAAKFPMIQIMKGSKHHLGRATETCCDPESLGDGEVAYWC